MKKAPLFAAAGGLLIGGAAQASVVIDIVQQGGDVVATVSGSLDGLSSVVDASLVDQKGINPGGFLETGVSGGLEYTYAGLQGSALGPELFTSATSSSGILFQVNLYEGEIFISKSYVQGTGIISSATWANTTLAALGLSGGTYHYSIGGNDIAFDIGPTMPDVPEPATWAMMILGFGAVGFGARKRKVAIRFGR